MFVTGAWSEDTEADWPWGVNPQERSTWEYHWA